MPGPLLVFSEPGASFPFRMLGFTDFHAMLHSWPLSVKYTLLIIRANSSGIWVLKANQAQNRYATIVICNTNAVMLILWVIYIFFNSTVIAGKNLLLVYFFISTLSIKDLIFRVTTIMTLKCPKVKYPFLFQSTAE